MAYTHAPVMVQQVLEILQPESGKRYLDGTLGGGGHAEQILERSSPDGQVLGLDLDAEAIAAAQQRLKRFGDRMETRWDESPRSRRTPFTFSHFISFNISPALV